MFKIHPVEERNVAENIYPGLLDDEMLFVVNEEGKFTGTGICSIVPDSVTIKKISAPYDDARMLMFLGILNYAERRGVKLAICKDNNLKDLCTRMNFNEDMTVELKDFFKPGAHCIHD